MHVVSRLVLSIDPLFKFQSEIGLVQTVRQGRVNVIYSAWGERESLLSLICWAGLEILIFKFAIFV